MDTSLPVPSGEQAEAAHSFPGTRLETLARVARRGWVRAAHVGVVVLAAVVYVFNLSVSGYANTYYSMAAQAASLDWAAWFWGALDPSNFITVDKPPLATMLMGLSVRVFGLSSWSILLPEAVCGVVTIAVLYAIVRRTSGPVAATLAAIVATLTPAAVLIFRYNNPDALLTLLLVLAAWAFMRAVSDGRIRWAVLAALFIGLAFNTKFLQAYLVLPAFALTYAIAAPGSVRRRLAVLFVAFATVVAASSWWVIAVQLVPASMRPYIGGSTDGSALQLLFGYDGLGRILGLASGAGPGIGAGIGGGLAGGQGGIGGAGGFSGTPGLLRIFNAQLGGQVAWLLPFALFSGVVIVAHRIRRTRTDVASSAAVMWTLWLITHVLLFSLMTGIIHSYYTVVMAPAIGALVGMGAVELWRVRVTHPMLGGVMLAAAIAASSVVAWQLLVRTPDFVPGLAWIVLVVGIATSVTIAAVPLLAARFAGTRGVARRATFAAAALGIVALLAGPAAYAADTMATPYSSGDPSAGPSMLTDGGGGFAGFPGGGSGGDGFGRGFGGGGRANRGPDGSSLDAATGPNRQILDYLVANRGSARWIVAANSSNESAPIQLASGEPVMTMGGFNGQDPAPTLDQLKQYIASGALRFVIGNTLGGFGGPTFGQDSGIDAWVQTNCTVVNLSGAPGVGLYDCATVR